MNMKEFDDLYYTGSDIDINGDICLNDGSVDLNKFIDQDAGKRAEKLVENTKEIYKEQIESLEERYDNIVHAHKRTLVKAAKIESERNHLKEENSYLRGFADGRKND